MIAAIDIGHDEERAEGRPHRGWHTPRGLPHFDSAQTTQAITFRLADALPKAVVAARRDEGAAAYRRRIDVALDAGAGDFWLRRAEIARIVDATLHHGAGRAYDLHAFVVMPNHVHVLVTQRQGHGLADVVQAWKGFSAKAINEALGRTGRVWQRDYHDRFVRDEVHFERALSYIEGNPVAAGLASSPEEWPISSAAVRARLVRDGGGTPPP